MAAVAPDSACHTEIRAIGTTTSEQRRRTAIAHTGRGRAAVRTSARCPAAGRASPPTDSVCCREERGPRPNDARLTRSRMLQRANVSAHARACRSVLQCASARAALRSQPPAAARYEFGATRELGGAGLPYAPAPGGAGRSNRRLAHRRSRLDRLGPHGWARPGSRFRRRTGANVEDHNLGPRAQARSGRLVSHPSIRDRQRGPHSRGETAAEGRVRDHPGGRHSVRLRAHVSRGCRALSGSTTRRPLSPTFDLALARQRAFDENRDPHLRARSGEQRGGGPAEL